MRSSSAYGQRLVGAVRRKTECAFPNDNAGSGFDWYGTKNRGNIVRLATTKCEADRNHVDMKKPRPTTGGATSGYWI
jgi:hypothetical protein